MNELLQRVCQKAHRIKTAFQTHQDAFLAHHQATLKWEALQGKEAHLFPAEGKDAALMLHNTETARDNARDTILSLAEGLLYATQDLLASLPDHEMKAIRRHTASLQEAVKAETTAFDLYNNAAGDLTKKHDELKTAQSEVISRTWPLVERILALSPCTPTMTGVHASWYFDQVEGLAEQGKPSIPPPPDPLAVATADTDLDGTSAHNTEIPAWALAETPEERDRIIYENRKATVGQKAAGRMIAQERYFAKRRNARTE